MKKIIVHSILIFFLLLASCSRAKYPTTTSDVALDFYKSGEELRLQLYFRNALNHYLAALKIDSTFALAAVQASQMYRNFGDGDSAEYFIKKARNLTPIMPVLERLIIQYYWADFNKKEKQMSLYADSLIALNPENFDVRVISAYECWRKLQFESSRKIFQSILRDYPNYIIAYNNIGYLYAREGLFKEAVSYLEKYKRYAASQLNPYDSLAEIYIAIGRYHEAIRILEYLIESRYDELIQNEYIGSTIITRTAEAYWKLGQYLKALDYLAQAEELYHSKYALQRIYLSRFRIYRDLNQTDQMEQVLDKIMTIIPDNKFTYYNAILHIEKSEFDQVLEILDNYKSTYQTDDASNHGYLITQAAIEGELNLKTGLYSEAADKFKLAADTYNDVLYELGLRTREYISLGLAGNYSEALDGLRKIIKINPNYPLALIYATEYYLKSNKKSEAQAFLNHFLNLWKNADSGSPLLKKARSLNAALSR